MDLHSEIINIQVDDTDRKWAILQAIDHCDNSMGRMMYLYELAHRDARHAAAELAWKAHADEWTNVTDKLPDFGVYIVELENRVVTEMIFSNIGGNRWFFVGVMDEYPDNKVVRWMPMPKGLIDEAKG